jgi:hypothetical protein
MTQTQKKLLEITQRNIYIQEDLQIPWPQNYTPKYQFNLRDSRMPNSNAYSFVVDWQIPNTDNQEIDKSRY